MLKINKTIIFHIFLENIAKSIQKKSHAQWRVYKKGAWNENKNWLCY